MRCEVNIPISETKNDYQWIRKSVGIGSKEPLRPKGLRLSPDPWIRKDEPMLGVNPAYSIKMEFETHTRYCSGSWFQP